MCAGRRTVSQSAQCTHERVPVDQAGRCTTDHFVKLTSHVQDSFLGEKVI